MSFPALRLDDVVVDYKRKHESPVRAVAGVSLDVLRGQVHGLVGESGCGKSTLAKASAGLVEVSSGQVLFDGATVQPLTRRARPTHLRKLQLIFQDPAAALNPRRLVGRQIEDALRLCGATESHKARERRVGELLETVGLPTGAGERYARELSGGQRQRVCLARALATDPSVIVADEPISALDASAQAQIANLLVQLARDLDIGVLFISHDLGIVRHIADHVTVMYLGKVVEAGPTRAVWSAPQHPYSESLMAAEPAHDGRGTLPAEIPGEVPNPANPPLGCRFHPRCPYAFEPCATTEPATIAVGEGHTSACWLREPVKPELLEAR
jgi:oligopeptide/dipeptide ABC transporter ATP-binding protein